MGMMGLVLSLGSNKPTVIGVNMEWWLLVNIRWLDRVSTEVSKGDTWFYIMGSFWSEQVQAGRKNYKWHIALAMFSGSAQDLFEGVIIVK